MGKRKPIVVGITGNIGVGKSTVMALLESKGAYIIDMDLTTRRALNSNGLGFGPVVQEFGHAILLDSGEINRDRLGQIVFGNPTRLSKLEGILHPIVFEMAKAELAEVRSEVVAIEAIKLLEAGKTSQLCDQVWVVTAPAEAQMQRLVQQRGMLEADARQRMAQQTSEAWKVSQADRVISNSGSVQDLRSKIDQIWTEILDTAP